jgi:Co/Zn/Cd efflux system component/copper chaperone CopZ
MTTARVTQYRVMGMDCARDAAEIEQAVRATAHVGAVKVSTASHILTVHGDEAALSLHEVEQAVTSLGYRLEPLLDHESGAAVAPRPVQTHRTASYRRALWIVVVLNLGYGVVEMFGGFLALSQALKADALDFLGDGFITMLGLLAIGWSAVWRARAALLQGIFLAALGLGVLATTGYRIFVQHQPHPETMGLFAVVALMVNLAAAAVLIPHRTGDANVRAVWLFSRNDAIGNIAVIGAAVLVAVTATPWPDLVVAFFIAGLFLHSAWSIIGDARIDLRQAPPGPTLSPGR